MSDGDAGYGRGGSYEQEFDEGYWEDEEDYEEFARSMDREYEAEKKRRAGTRRQGGSGSAGGKAGSRKGRGGRSRTADNAGSRESRGSSKGRQVSRRDASDRYAGEGQRFIEDRPQDGRTDTRRRKGAAGSAEEVRGRGTSVPPKKKKKKKKGFFGILLRLIVIVLLIGVIAAGFLAYQVKDVLEMQRVNSVDLEEELRQNLNHQVRNDQMMEGYKNIALFGVDSRSGDLLDGDNRSDTMMIASINEETGEIRLVSVYRDTVLDVGDGYYTKANTAYALGGPAQAITMLNQNLDLNILDFVTVGFEGLAHTIDALGGIEIEIDEEERGYLNQYVHDMNIELGTDPTPVEETGLVTVTGIQATAYSRIRYTAGDDFRRAERQRTVLKKTLEKAKNASPTTLVDVANNVVGDMATSLSSREIVSLILMASKLELKDTGGIPQEDARDFTDIEAGSAVMPDTLEDNAVWLHKFLFNDDSYQISDEVRERNDWMVNNLEPISYW